MLRSMIRRCPPVALVVSLALTAGCPMDMGDDFVPLLALSEFATNTDGASAIAVRPSDGAVFIVNADGLFGPITAGTNLAAMTPFGAANLGTLDLFDSQQPQLALAITNSGEFWIGSSADGTMAVVPPGGGDAEPFPGLIEAPTDDVTPLNIFPDTLVLVPANGGGTEFMPGDLLAGEATTFSRLAAIDPATDDVVKVDNPSATNRNAFHLAFDSNGDLFSSRDTTSLTTRGIQRIAADGTPTFIDNTEGLAAPAFVIEDSGDFIIRGALAESGGISFTGLFILDAGTGALLKALQIPASAASAADDMVLLPNGTILMTQPNLNRVVRIDRVP
jgi:hypothetical protein